jgi:uncharacterized protein YccT (UPF0319 family)
MTECAVDIEERTITRALMSQMTALAKENNRAVNIAAIAWVEEHCAGVPEARHVEDNLRDDAKFWASLASPNELEAYLAAAIVALEGSAITSRAAKRLGALGFNRMDNESRAGFLQWIKKQEEETE